MAVVAREGSVSVRCPYCHDALAEAGPLPEDDLVECPGCTTRHHRACIEELGRCTILGCEKAIRPRSSRLPKGDEPLDPRRSEIRRAVEQRLRERVRTFVHDHVRPVEEEDLRRALVRDLTQALAAEEAQDWAAAGSGWDEVARWLTLARPGDLADARGLETLDLPAVGVMGAAEAARERARRLRMHAEGRRVLRSAALYALGFIAVLVGALVLGSFVSR